MNYKKMIIMVMTSIVIIISCEKEDTNNNISAKENTISNIIGENPDMSLVAFKSSESTSSGYEYIELIGHSEINIPDCRYFAITIYASSIAEKTYIIPEYTSGYVYENASGYAIGYYSASPSNTVTDWFYSQYVAGAKGIVTISNLTNDIVEGSYDMTLVSFKDRTKTMKFKGNFNASLGSYSN